MARLVSRGRGVISNRLVWTLKPGSHTIGRTIGNTFIIPNSSIPTTAAVIDYNHDDGKFYIYPKSTKGVSVNGTKLTRKRKLVDGDILRFVVEEFEFQTIRRAEGEEAEGEGVAAAEGAAEGVAAPQAEAGAQPEAAAVDKVSSAYAVANNLQRVLAYINEFQSASSILELAEKLLDAVIDVTKTRRAFFFMIGSSEEDAQVALEELASRAAGGMPLQNKSYDISQSFIQKVLDGHGMVIIQDAIRENVMTATMFKHQLRALVCVPIMLRDERTGQEETVGIIYADNFLPTQDLPPDCGTTLNILAQVGSQKLQQRWEMDEMKMQLEGQTNVLNYISQEVVNVWHQTESAVQSVGQGEDPSSTLREVQERVSLMQEEINKLSEG